MVTMLDMKNSANLERMARAAERIATALERLSRPVKGDESAQAVVAGKESDG